jgi:hypothetical protein
MEARDIPTALLIKFHTERFQEEMRTESQNGWCKQPPILGYVRTFGPRTVPPTDDNLHCTMDYDVGCIRPYGKLELKERGIRDQHQSQRKYQVSKAFTPKTKPRGASTRLLNKYHSASLGEDWRRIPLSSLNKRPSTNAQRRLYEKVCMAQAVCLYATQAHAWEDTRKKIGKEGQTCHEA